MSLTDRELLISQLNLIELPGYMAVSAANKLIPPMMASMKRACPNQAEILNTLLDLYESRVELALRNFSRYRAQDTFGLHWVKSTLFRSHFVTHVRAGYQTPIQRREINDCLNGIPWFELYVVMSEPGKIFQYEDILKIDFVEDCKDVVTPDELMKLKDFLNTRDRKLV